MNFDLNTLVSLLFIAGGGGAVAGILNVVKTLRSGKIESEETLIKRLDASNKEQLERAQRAEKRADELESEAARYRRNREQALEYAARLRVLLIQNQIEPPPEPEELR